MVAILPGDGVVLAAFLDPSRDALRELSCFVSLAALHCNNEAVEAQSWGNKTAAKLHISCVTAAMVIAGFGWQVDLPNYTVIEHSAVVMLWPVGCCLAR